MEAEGGLRATRGLKSRTATGQDSSASFTAEDNEKREGKKRAEEE